MRLVLLLIFVNSEPAHQASVLFHDICYGDTVSRSIIIRKPHDEGLRILSQLYRTSAVRSFYEDHPAP